MSVSHAHFSAGCIPFALPQEACWHWVWVVSLVIWFNYFECWLSLVGLPNLLPLPVLLKLPGACFRIYSYSCLRGRDPSRLLGNAEFGRPGSISEEVFNFEPILKQLYIKISTLWLETKQRDLVKRKEESLSLSMWRRLLGKATFPSWALSWPQAFLCSLTTIRVERR